jgi:hypothetical protein
LALFLKNVDPALQGLMLRNCAIDDNDMRALEHVPGLHLLDLRQNSLSSLGAAHLSTYLSTSSHVTTLRLAHNNTFGDAGIVALATALVSNTSVVYLDVRSTGFGVAGMEALAMVLARNTPLEQFLIGGNNFGDVGAKALGYGLSTNNTLWNLNLASNGLGETGASELFQSLQVNKALTQVRSVIAGQQGSDASSVQQRNSRGHFGHSFVLGVRYQRDYHQSASALLPTDRQCARSAVPGAAS